MRERFFKRAVVVLVAFTLFAGMMACAGLQIKDPLKTALYTIKQEWLAVREYVVGEYLQGRMTDQQVQDFRQRDNEFTRLYELTLLLRNTGADNQVLLEGNLTKLRNLLLEARRRYYPGEGT